MHAVSYKPRDKLHTDCAGFNNLPAVAHWAMATERRCRCS